MAKYSLRLGHLYPKLLNIYGDYGNVLALKNRCMWRGIELEIEEINIGDRVVEHDIYFMGGGQDAQQIIVSKELQNVKDDLKLEQENGAVFLAICGGYQLLGHYYQPQQGEKLLGVELLNIYTIAGEKRFIGNGMKKPLKKQILNIGNISSLSLTTFCAKSLTARNV